jgi:hypothetical protein
MTYQLQSDRAQGPASLVREFLFGSRLLLLQFSLQSLECLVQHGVDVHVSIVHISNLSKCYAKMLKGQDRKSLAATKPPLSQPVAFTVT